jgi:hypothetical protein
MHKGGVKRDCPGFGGKTVSANKNPPCGGFFFIGSKPGQA